ncbi:MAG: Ig-like domain-containing protein [Planctomycetes bacterium]|nr:Ig-like domain-containing protein [Planctomycetota bacterium]
MSTPPIRSLALATAILVSFLVAACSGGGSGSEDLAIVDPTLSAVLAPDASGIANDGVDTATLTILLRGDGGEPVAGRAVTVSASGTQNAFWPSATVITDAAGRADVRISSTSAGSKVVQAAVVGAGGASLVLADAPTVQFVEADVPRERVSVSSSGAEANDFSG